VWFWLALVLGSGAIAWATRRLAVIPVIGGGYKAKVLCTAIFASGRAMDPQHADEVSADSLWILRPLRARVDPASQTVTVSLAGRFARTAIHRAGMGATLLDRRHDVVALANCRPERRSHARALTVASGSPELQRVVEQSFEEHNPRRRRRTHAIVVIHDGRIVAERYARGVTADTPLPGWSMTKSVLNALIGILVAEGRLALGECSLMPAWQAPDPRADITLEDLLRMRSGLRFSENYSNPWSDVLHMLYDCADTGAYAASRPLARAPGTVWQYSSGTTNILSRIVRRVVGDADYWSWPRRVLFDRLDMASAVLEPDASGTFVCSSYMLATARDWARFGLLWANGGMWANQEILTSEWIRFSTDPTPESGGRFGAHLWLKLNPEIGGDDPAARTIASDTFFAVGHEGQTLTIMPSRRLVVVRLGAAIHIDAWNHAQFVAAVQQSI
jgi:CubicO group peptidase (beta-lactamase class C family)